MSRAERRAMEKAARYAALQEWGDVLFHGGLNNPLVGPLLLRHIPKLQHCWRNKQNPDELLATTTNGDHFYATAPENKEL